MFTSYFLIAQPNRIMNNIEIMKPLIFSLILFLFLFLAPGSSHASEIIVLADNYPPWKIAQGGKITGGIDTYLIATLFKGLDLTPSYELCPWKRCLVMMQDGDGDLISGITLTKDRQNYLTYITPPYKTKSQKVLFVRRGMSTKYRTLADMEQKNIGLLRGAKYFPLFHENQAIFKSEHNTDIQGMKMVMAGRLDGFLITKENGEYLLKNNQRLKSGLEIALWRHNENVEVYFAISKRSKLIIRIKELEKRLHHLIDSGEIEKIIQFPQITN